MHSLQHFVSPLRGAFTTSHPPITILNDAEQTPEFSRIMSKFRDVVRSIQFHLKLIEHLIVLCAWQSVGVS